MDILNTAVEAAKKRNISTIVVASTTGETAYKLSNIVKDKKLKIIVVNHDEGKLAEQKRFREDIRLQLLAKNITVYTHSIRWGVLKKLAVKILGRLGLLAWRKYLKRINEEYGTGIKVANIIVKMLTEAEMLKNGKVIAIAGRKKGADSVGVFSVNPKKKWPILEEVIVNKMN